MMTCRELSEFLGDYRSRELDPETRQRFEEHLRGCAQCVAYGRSYEQTIRLARLALRDPLREVPAEVPEELVAAILASRGRRPGATTRKR
jgi:anti-sigma factor RsiW